MIGIVYKITNKINGKCYVGQTVRSLQRRWKSHFNPSNHSYFGNVIRKYGPETFSLEILGKYENLEDLNNAEEYFVEFYNSLRPNGYNLRMGGGSKGRNTEESNKKNSLSHKGKVFSEEHKKNISKSKSGQNATWFGKPSPRRTPIVCLNNGIIYSSQLEAARELNLRVGNIHRVLNSESGSTGGFRFKYLEG